MRFFYLYHSSCIFFEFEFEKMATELKDQWNQLNTL